MKPITITLLLLSVAASGCELFVIGGSGKQVATIERSQKTSVGVVYLWKAELDSNNLVAVTELMRHKSGRKLLASERYDLADDLEHWKNLIGSKPITASTVDTLSGSQHTVHATIDHIRSVTFSTLYDKEAWYVTGLQ